MVLWGTEASVPISSQGSQYGNSHGEGGFLQITRNSQQKVNGVFQGVSDPGDTRNKGDSISIH